MGKTKIIYFVGVFTIFIALTNRLKLRKEHMVALFFLATIFIAAMFSSFRQIALWGSAARSEGFFMYLMYIILFIVSSNYLKVNKKLIDISMIGASLVSIYGILQIYGIDFIQMWIFKTIYSPLSATSTIGNRNFFSTYVCLFLFISIGVFIFYKDNKYIIFSTILFLGLLASMTRGGWLTFAIIFLCLLVFVIKRKDCIIRVGVLILVFLVALVILNSTTNNMIFNRGQISTALEIVKTEPQKTTESTASESTASGSTASESNTSSTAQSPKAEESTSKIELLGTASERQQIANLCTRVFLNSPILGEGPDTLKSTLMRDFPEEFKAYQVAHKASIDKAHSEYIEYLACDGIFTLISYLVLVSMILLFLFKNRKDDKNIIILLAVLAYLVQAVINISVPMVAPLFWILLGYAVKIPENERIVIE